MKTEFAFHNSLKVLHKGCAAPHSYLIPFQSADAAASYDRAESNRFLSLCGEWNFRYCKNGNEAAEFLSADIPCYEETIEVPRSWQTYTDRAYDRPLYTNIRYPFPVDPPHVPAENPCGVYQRTVDIPEGLCGKYDMRLVFEGVDSCFYLYINGKFAAYSQASHTPSEAMVSSFLHEGKNDITVVVFKWCDGSYLEDQDKIRLSGIFREVYLLLRDKNHIEDIYVKTVTEKPFDRAEILVNVTMCGKAKAEYVLTAPDGREISRGALVTDGKTFNTIKVENPLLWSDETPSLYNLFIKCGGETILQQVGIRRIEIVNKVILINGRKVKAKGVNRHDSHPQLGARTPLLHIWNDLMLLKRHNINFIRTSHYPNDPRFYELCNRLGFYVCDETDIETHGMQHAGNWDAITDSPEWTEAYVDRAARMMERDKNYACIVMWSVGNESGIGCNHRAEAEYFHRRMPGCIVHSEDFSRRVSYLKRDGKTAELEAIPQGYLDVDSRMYPSYRQIEDEYLGKKAKRPFFLCEYSHAMGNGPGDIEGYWKQIYSNDCFFGGCVWELTDHSVDMGTPGQPKYIYGGHFGNPVNDGCFCVDGLVYPDRRPHQGLLELKQVLRPCRAVAFDATGGKVTLKNYRHFTSLSDLDLLWTVEAGGHILESGRIAGLNIPAERSRTYKLRYGDYSAEHLYLTLRFVQNAPTLWADTGYEVGFEQFELPSVPCEKAVLLPLAYAGFSFAEDGNFFTVTDGETVYKIDRLSGLLCSVRDRGQELITSPLTPNIWRAPTDNDRNLRPNWENALWHIAGAECSSCTVAKQDDACIEIVSELTLGAPSKTPVLRGSVRYVFKPGCGVKLHFVWDANVPEKCLTLPRIGVRFRMPAGTENLEYFGLGPTESYQDKRQAAKMGLYRTSVTDNFEHYIRPQENMAHDGTAFVSVCDAAGRGLCVRGAGDTSFFSFNASHFTPDQLAATRYDYELVPMSETIVCVDMKQAGIGSNSCGPALAGEYRLGSGRYEFAFEIKPAR